LNFYRHHIPFVCFVYFMFFDHYHYHPGDFWLLAQ
jgi:hypothetical protein